MAIIRRSEKRETTGGSESQQQRGGRWVKAPIYDRPEDYVEEELGCWTPSVDILDGKDSIKLFVELPGMDKKDVTINIESGVLTITGERQALSDEPAKWLRQERCYGGFCRSFSVNNLIDQERIGASMDKGMLVLTLPYREDSKPKQIEVKIQD
jgi:HSP20 family protein